MGWEWTFDFEFEHGYPSAEAFEQLFSAVATLSGQTTIPRVEIHDFGSGSARRKGRFKYSWKTPEYTDVPVSDAISLVQNLKRDHILYVFLEGTRIFDSTPEPAWSWLYIFRSLFFPDPERRGRPRCIEYDVGRGGRYQQPPDAESPVASVSYNLAQVRRELAAIFAAVPEMTLIRANHNYYNGDPLEDSYRLHRTFGQFLTDVGKPADSLGDDAILEIMLDFCSIDPDFTVELHPFGVEVFFERKGSYGGLRQFYDYFRQQVTGGI